MTKQRVPKTSSPKPAEKTITLPDDDWLLIDRALQQMPYGQVAPLYQRMNAQFAAQRPEDATTGD